jgi:hypothetical protein
VVPRGRPGRAKYPAGLGPKLIGGRP